VPIRGALELVERAEAGGLFQRKRAAQLQES